MFNKYLLNVVRPLKDSGQATDSQAYNVEEIKPSRCGSYFQQAEPVR